MTKAGRTIRRRAMSAFLSVLLAWLAGCSRKDWRTASRESAGIAPNPAMIPDAVVQVPELELELPFTAIGSGYARRQGGSGPSAKGANP